MDENINVNGGGGNDTLDGGAGTDTATYANAAGAVAAVQPGKDTIGVGGFDHRRESGGQPAGVRVSPVEHLVDVVTPGEIAAPCV